MDKMHLQGIVLLAQSMLARGMEMELRQVVLNTLKSKGSIYHHLHGTAKVLEQRRFHSRVAERRTTSRAQGCGGGRTRLDVDRRLVLSPGTHFVGGRVESIPI